MPEIEQGNRTVIPGIRVRNRPATCTTRERGRSGRCGRLRSGSRILVAAGNSGGTTFRIARIPNTRSTLIHTVATLLREWNALWVSEIEQWNGTVIAWVRSGNRPTAGTTWKRSRSRPRGHAATITFRIPCGRGFFVTSFVVHRILRQEGLEREANPHRRRATTTGIGHRVEQTRRYLY